MASFRVSLFGNEVSIFECVINCPCDDLIYWFTYYIGAFTLGVRDLKLIYLEDFILC